MKPDHITHNFLQAQIYYQKHINSMAYHAHIPTYSAEDLQQELLMILFQTVVDYDPMRGATFGTIFYRRAKNHLAKLYNRMHTKKRTASFVWLEQEEVILQIERLQQEPSAEEYVFAKLQVYEKIKGNRIAATG